MLTDAALRADREAKLAAAIAHLGDKYVLAKPITRASLKQARADTASVPVHHVEPLLELVEAADMSFDGPYATLFVARLNRLNRAIRDAKAAR